MNETLNITVSIMNNDPAYDACEISDIIREKIDNFDLSIDINKSGKVLDSKYGLCRIYGLQSSTIGSLVEFESGALGVVTNRTPDGIVLIALLGKKDSISDNDTCLLLNTVIGVKITDKENQPSVHKTLVVHEANTIGSRLIAQEMINNMRNILKKTEKHWVELNSRKNKKRKLKK